MAGGKLINELGTAGGGWAGSMEYFLDLIHRISIRWTKCVKIVPFGLKEVQKLAEDGSCY